jgi:adenylate cyclase
MMKKNRNRFFTSYNELELEIIKSEHNRTRLMILALLVIIAISTLNSFFLDDVLASFFGGADIYYFVVGGLTGLMLFEGIVLLRINWFHKKGLRLPPVSKFMSSFIEVSFPSFLMYYMVTVKGHHSFIDSPLFALYFLILILSTLHLSFLLSFSLALVAALEYSAIIYMAFSSNEDATRISVLPEVSYYVRCGLILLCGAAAGFVAEEIKKRIRSYFVIHRSKNEIELTFGQQVSQEVVKAIAEQANTAKQVEATVLVFDIRNFSPFAEKHSPDEILDFQNKVFGPILDIVRQHNGIVNQILGDGIMATFGAPVSHPHHAQDALQAAIDIRKKISELISKAVIPEINIGIGIHAGEVITGNIGNEHRKQYSVTGAAVIIAFRVEKLNKEFNSEVLITETIKDKIDGSSVSLTTIGPTSMKGIGGMINIYKVN